METSHTDLVMVSIQRIESDSAYQESHAVMTQVIPWATEWCAMILVRYEPGDT